MKLTLSFSISDEFNVYVHEAGAGMLAVSIDGPSKAKIDIQDRGTAFVTVSYIVESAGRISLSRFFSDFSSL